MRFLPTLNTTFAVAPMLDQCRFTDVEVRISTHIRFDRLVLIGKGEAQDSIGTACLQYMNPLGLDGVSKGSHDDRFISQPFRATRAERTSTTPPPAI